jgi:hypothetical protein
MAWGALGKSLTWMAANIGVDKATLRDWAHIHPEFATALTRAKMASQCWWEDAGQAGLDIPGFNASLWAKNIASRFPQDWRDSREMIADDGPNRAAAGVETRARIAELIERLGYVMAGAGDVCAPRRLPGIDPA